MSESKANLHRHRGNHMQTLTILGSTVKSPVDICLAGSPTPAKPEVVFFSGAIAVRFFSREGGGRSGGRGGSGPQFGAPSFRLAFTQSALLHLRHRFETLQGCLQDAQSPPKYLQDASKGTPRTLKLCIIHANPVSASCFKKSFTPFHSF